MARVFVTGAGGFIGKSAVQVLLSRGHRVAGLVHRAAPPSGVDAVRGDLLAPDSYRQAVADADLVLHLAAATGRADAATHSRVNTEGTRLLAGVCAETRRPLLFVSSVAVQYSDHSHYPYAAAKAAAEAAVRASGTPCVIARPTIVTGPGSPVIGGLARLATLPLVPMFGDGRTRVQPVDVADVALVLADILEQGGFGAETIGIGGPEIVTIEALMLAIRHAAGRAGGTVLHLPLSMVQPALLAGERLTGGRVPLTAGQLSLFRYDGTVPPHPITDARRPSMHSLADTLRRSVAA